MNFRPELDQGGAVPEPSRWGIVTSAAGACPAFRELQEHASTVVMETRDLNEIRTTCDRAIWLEGGRVQMDGPADEVVDAHETD